MWHDGPRTQYFLTLRLSAHLWAMKRVMRRHRMPSLGPHCSHCQDKWRLSSSIIFQHHCIAPPCENRVQLTTDLTQCSCVEPPRWLSLEYLYETSIHHNGADEFALELSLESEHTRLAILTNVIFDESHYDQVAIVSEFGITTKLQLLDYLYQDLPYKFYLRVQ